MDGNITDRLAGVLSAAGRAHTAAFTDRGGADPDWPTWYAEYALDDVRAVLERPRLSKRRLAASLAAADEAFRDAAPAEPWWRFYAVRLAIELLE